MDHKCVGVMQKRGWSLGFMVLGYYVYHPIRFNKIHTTQNRNLPYLKPNLGAVPCNMIAKVKKKKRK